jgi:hypothetical protein
VDLRSVIWQQLIARLLLAQSSDEAEHVKLVSCALALFHVESMGVVVRVIELTGISVRFAAGITVHFHRNTQLQDRITSMCRPCAQRKAPTHGRSFVAVCLVSAAFSEACAEQAEGNYFFLRSRPTITAAATAPANKDIVPGSGTGMPFANAGAHTKPQDQKF